MEITIAVLLMTFIFRVSGFSRSKININLLGGRKQVYLHSFKKKPSFKNDIESKYFDFNRLEQEIYTWWETSEYFKPSPDKAKKTYVIPMPPPNVTGIR